jgi:hypothetical protein
VIYEKQTGPSSTALADTLVSLAVAVGKQGRVSDAEALFKRGLTLTETTYGAEHLTFAKALSAYAQFLKEQNRAAEADVFTERAESIRAKNAPGHPTS